MHHNGGIRTEISKVAVKALYNCRNYPGCLILLYYVGKVSEHTPETPQLLRKSAVVAEQLLCFGVR